LDKFVKFACSIYGHSGGNSYSGHSKKKHYQVIGWFGG